jgi:hypothetical protein
MFRSTSLDPILSQINLIHILASHLGRNNLQKYSNSRIITEKKAKGHCPRQDSQRVSKYKYKALLLHLTCKNVFCHDFGALRVTYKMGFGFDD